MNRISYENTILILMMMVSFINPFTSSALTTALPDIGNAYGASEMALSWVIETFLIASWPITIMPISKMADRWVNGASSSSAWLSSAALLYRCILFHLFRLCFSSASCRDWPAPAYLLRIWLLFHW